LVSIEPTLVRKLLERAQGARWGVTPDRFAVALSRSAEKSFGGQVSAPEVDRYVSGLHLDDLALACACEDGHEAAWEHFVREFRPVLYRAAAAIDPAGGARDLADSLYGELFGLKETGGTRQSLFRYFHGRSSLATWLRSVLSQRHVDRMRAGRREAPLPDEHAQALTASPVRLSPDRRRHVSAVIAALTAVVAELPARDRLRLACYYAQNLTLAQIGRLTNEHEATVSRHLTRTRKAVRAAVEQRLTGQGMAEPEIAEAVTEAAEDAGVFDLDALLGEGRAGARKGGPRDRST
jgi:RNA polymerase sigma factor (sigma-70 family)